MAKKTLFLLLVLILSSCGIQSQGPLISEKGAITVSFLVSDEINKDETPTGENSNDYIPGTKLVNTDWGQSYPYNGLLPLINGQRPVSGCVSIVYAQIINYLRPQIIRQTTLEHDFAAPNKLLRYQGYNWDEITKFETEGNQNGLGVIEVQRLIRDTGIIADTTYGTEKSSAYTGENFKYIARKFGIMEHIEESEFKAAIISGKFKMQNMDEFQNIVIENINAKKPIITSLSGKKFPIVEKYFDDEKPKVFPYDDPIGEDFNHAIIIDGYKFDEDGKFLVHLNWGWTGRRNGFFNLDDGIKIKQKLGKVLQFKEDEFQTIVTEELIFIPKLTIYHSYEMCSDEESCPETSNEQTTTTYEKNIGLVESTKSKGHKKTHVASLYIDTYIKLKNISGVYKIIFENMSEKSQITYIIDRYSASYITNLYSGTDLNGQRSFPKGSYNVYLQELTSKNLDLNKIPIKFHIRNKDNRPFNHILVDVEKRESSLAIELDNESPIIRSSKTDEVIHLPITGVEHDKKYDLKILNSDDSTIELVGNNLILKNTLDNQMVSNVTIALIDRDSQQELVEKKYMFTKSDKMLYIASPKLSIKGNLDPKEHNSFYFYASGVCKISGYRGYSSQGFYYSVYSKDDQEFSWVGGSLTSTRLKKHEGNEKEETFNFPAGFYNIKASNGYGLRFYHITEKKDFSISIDCSESSKLGIEQIIDFYNRN